MNANSRYRRPAKARKLSSVKEDLERHGEWLTVAQTAAVLGIAHRTMNNKTLVGWEPPDRRDGWFCYYSRDAVIRMATARANHVPIAQKPASENDPDAWLKAHEWCDPAIILKMMARWAN